MRDKAASLLAVPVLVVAGLAGAPSGALAQQGLAAARACTSITADAERLACYDRALRSEPAAHTQAGPSESTPPSAESSPAASAAATPPARSESTAVAKRERPTRREARAERKARRASAAEKSASAAKQNEFEVTIVKVDRIRGRSDTFFITDDGQVWKQSDEKLFLTPHPPFRAIISEGSLGSHFLSLPGGHFQISVYQPQH